MPTRGLELLRVAGRVISRSAIITCLPGTRGAYLGGDTVLAFRSAVKGSFFRFSDFVLFVIDLETRRVEIAGIVHQH